MKIQGKEVLWLSQNGNVAVAYSQWDLGCKFKIFRKVKYGENKEFEYSNSFCTQTEAINYAKKMHDVIIER